MIDKQVSKPADSRHTPYSGLHLPLQPHKYIRQVLEHTSWIACECKAQPLRQKISVMMSWAIHCSL